jgi:PTS system mannose-specific IIB component
MENILLARVDDRLIHGQVMTAWMKSVPAKQIIIIDDSVALDEFMIKVLELAAPKGVMVRVFDVEGAVSFLSGGLETPSILLAKTPITYKCIIDAGIQLDAINLGGMGINQNRRKLHKNLAASEEERTAIREMLDKGIDVKIQVIPADKAVGVAGLL